MDQKLRTLPCAISTLTFRFLDFSLTQSKEDCRCLFIDIAPLSLGEHFIEFNICGSEHHAL